MSIRAGITGGIGSGKSVVSKILMKMGYPVFDADSEAKKLLYDAQIREQIISLLGEKAYSGHEPDRKQIAAMVFDDSRKLQELNQIIHPAVKAKFKQWCDDHQHSSIVFKEAAIMFESGSYQELNFITGIDAPETLRIQRVKARDQKNEDEIKKIISKQMASEELLARCDYIIRNDNHSPLIPQVLTMIQTIRNTFLKPENNNGI